MMSEKSIEISNIDTQLQIIPIAIVGMASIAQSVLLKAPTPVQLLGRCEDILGQLQSDAGERHYAELIDECKSLEIPVTDARVGFVADCLRDACSLLLLCIDWLRNSAQAQSWQHPQGIYYRKTGIIPKGKVVALFSGQGSEYLEMGRELVINFPCLRQTYGYMDSLFIKDGLKPLSDTVFPPAVFDTAPRYVQSEALTLTEYAQPAIGVFSVGLYKILQQAGFKPDLVAGHSFGELTALWAGEVLSDEDYFFLIKARGQAMATPDQANVDPGAMQAAHKAFAQAISAVTFKSAKIPVYTNISGNLYPTEPQSTQKILKEHLSNSVLFKREIENIYSEGGYVFIEFGPRNILTNLVKETLGDQPHLAVALNASRQKDSDRTLRSAVMQLRVVGLPLKNLDSHQLERKKPDVRKNQALSVPLDRVNYVLKNTEVDLEKALPDGHQVKFTANQPDAISVSKSILPTSRTDTVTQNRTKPAPVANGNKLAESSDPMKSPEETPEPKIQPRPEVALNYQRVLESLEYSIAQFNHHQSHVLQVHEQSLKYQNEYIKTFFQLMQQQNLLFANGKSPTDQAQTKVVVIESSERSMMRFHDHQGETLRVHGEYLNHQMEYANNFFQFIQQQYGLLITGDSTEPEATPVVSFQNSPAVLPTAKERAATKQDSSNDPQSHQSDLNHNILRYIVRLKTQPSPDFFDFTLPDEAVALITDDGSLTTSKLAHSLTERGWKVVVLSFPQFLIAQRSSLPAGITRVLLKDLSEEHLKQQLAVIDANYGQIAAFIHLNPSSRNAQSQDIRYIEAEAALVKQVFMIAKHLKQPLAQAARQGRSCFITVAHLDGEFGTGRKTNFGAIGGGLFGLTKTLNQEWSSVFCRAIDLSPDLAPEQSVQYILAELHDPNRLITEVGYTFGRRTTLVCIPDTVTERAKG